MIIAVYYLYILHKKSIGTSKTLCFEDWQLPIHMIFFSTRYDHITLSELGLTTRKSSLTQL